MSQMERLYWMDAVLQNGGRLRFADAKAKFEISHSRFYDDLKYLSDRLGAPLVPGERRGSWRYAEKTYRLPFLALANDKADALYRTFQAAIAHLPPADAQAARRVAALLSPYIRGLPQHGDGALPATGELFLAGYPTLATPLSESLLADLRRATDNRHRVRLTYYSAHRDETDERTIQPYYLLNWRGELYLIARCEWRQGTRDFALHRIAAYDVLEPAHAFTLPGDFDVEAHLQRALELQRGDPLVTVKIRFSRHQARWIREREYHASQTLAEEPDGSILLTMTVSGTADVKRWVLSYGADAEVLEPETLRQEISTDVRQLTGQYAK